MEPLFDFLRQYWWLIFPTMFVLGGIGSAWERGARRRHRRRLEVLKAKAELKAAQAAARAGAGSVPIPAVGAAATASAPSKASAESMTAELERLFAEHDATTARWLEYELDVAKLIAFPAMSDGRQPLTAAFLRAKRVADGLRPASSKARITPEQLAEYRNAVTDYEVAFDVAERDARRLRDSSFSADERKRLDTAKQLLTVAIDQAATPAERQLAYRRVREELDGLILLSDEAIEVLEKKVMLELGPGESGTAGARGDASASSAPKTAQDPDAAPQPHPVGDPAPWPVPSRRSSPTPSPSPGPSPDPGRGERPSSS
ncbi:hypothetical protein [Microbacterium sp.]|uniref:hypothetical protein n=1 Tax=Microbacterium sp. TaxID=51671 RepID=UPI002D792FB5|nr:hypothetical protein [Microbacterium sp.]HET6302227.1 hypothetical protein [Microbacterium sp.]